MINIVQLSVYKKWVCFIYCNPIGKYQSALQFFRFQCLSQLECSQLTHSSSEDKSRIQKTIKTTKFRSMTLSILRGISVVYAGCLGKSLWSSVFTQNCFLDVSPHNWHCLLRNKQICRSRWWLSSLPERKHTVNKSMFSHISVFFSAAYGSVNKAHSRV